MKLFVYYKFLPDEYPELKMHVQHMQMRMQTQFAQLGAQVMKRPSPDELGQVTWMEIYEGVGDIDAFEQCLAAAAQAANFAAVLVAGGVRHMERFEDPCA